MHFSTLREGGAFRALKGIHDNLDRAYFESDILHPEPLETSAPYLQTIQQECVFSNRSSISNSYFSGDWSLYRQPSAQSIRIADLYHFHWVSDWFDSRYLTNLASYHKPAVWTLHDFRTLSGGCHFPAGCDQWRNGCAECPQLADQLNGFVEKCFQNLKSAVEALNPVFVAPSRWLYDACRNSAIASKQRVELIPYGVDHRFFIPGDQVSARMSLNLPLDRRIFLLVAQQVRELRKGYEETIQAWHEVTRASKDLEPPLLLTVGENWGNSQDSTHVRELGFLKDPLQLRSAYQSADVFVCPSQEDNLPNVVLEAMACGLPIFAANVGGLPDLVENGKGGCLVSYPSVHELSIGLRYFLECRQSELYQMGLFNRAKIENCFTLERQANLYKCLYDSLDPQSKNTSKPMPGNSYDPIELLNWASRRNRSEITHLQNILKEQMAYIEGLKSQVSQLNRYSLIKKPFGLLFNIYRLFSNRV